MEAKRNPILRLSPGALELYARIMGWDDEPTNEQIERANHKINVVLARYGDSRIGTDGLNEE